MNDLLQWLPNSDALLPFMYQGGPILWWLGAVVIIFWLIIFERVIFFSKSFPENRKVWITKWQARTDHHSWYARAQRDGMLSEAEDQLNQHLKFLKCLLSLCPMLGLLGTVTGMITVFDTLAAQGNAEPRLMAAGISMATIPTMAGMVAALSGMLAYSRLTKWSHISLLKLEKLLRSDACA
ncbi:MotA/TolQ/ExbB proton channel family protein [Vibrio sp. SS-MA-C1-2]|uniref:MotA/TolQ/ExbB proton channel family protein n=1 Tax=Vibrio sp. SS-MA-C1-2 TaxID=2908646 RepID=UPI001F3D4DFF|nr:MotA/TolQ/ExbB proton channel family protein [Vibrio sp. SS-MA-C1-2]UJF18392.1 MotA/TolQ/ExbB proton channel family protein [Vibrio sp. SS-MA-C1-2]